MPFRSFRPRAAAAAAALCLAAAAALPARAATDEASRPGELLVKLRSASALPAVQTRYRLVLVDRFGTRPIYRFQAVDPASVDRVLAAMAADPDVLLSERNHEQRAPEARRNQPWAIGQASAYAVQWAYGAIRLPAAQALARGAGVRVAVLDTGVDRRHPALAGRMLPGFDFVDFDTDPSEAGAVGNAGYGHGTHVAGLVAAVAPSARLMPLRVLDAQGVGNAWVLAEAMLHAVDPDHVPATDDGAQVLNLSLGTLARNRVLRAALELVTCARPDAADPVLNQDDPGYAADKARCALRGGAVVVAAAGNDGSDALRQYPAAFSSYGLLSVGASAPARSLAGFSNRGSWVALAAPGAGVTSTVPGSGYATWSGTSMAAPLAAGVAALVRGREPQLPPRDVVRRLVRSGQPLCGSALAQLDAAAALGLPAAPPAACP